MDGVSTKNELMDIKNVLIACFQDEVLGDGTPTFFDNYFKIHGQGFFFLFKKNLRVTNIQFAELVSLLKRYSTSNQEENIGSKFHIFTAPQFNATVKELRDGYLLDKNNRAQVNEAAQHFAETYYTLLQHVVIIDPYYTSCSVFIPPFTSIDLKTICGVSGYIHSCGSHVYVRNIEKATYGKFASELDTVLKKIITDRSKKILFSVLSHEDFPKTDTDIHDGSSEALDGVKIYEEKCYMGLRPLVDIIEDLRNEFADEIYIARRNQHLEHHKIQEQSNGDIDWNRSIWLIMDKKIDANSMKYPDESSYYICYEQRYINANQLHLFDEDKLAWKSNTTLPHTLCSAMLNMALSNVSVGSVHVCDPFLGSGTTFFETLKFQNLFFSGFDTDLLSRELFEINLKFFSDKRMDVQEWHNALLGISRSVDVKEKQFRSNLGRSIEKIQLLLHTKVQGEYLFSSEDINAIRRLDSRERVLFFLMLRVGLKYTNQEVRSINSNFHHNLLREAQKTLDKLDQYTKLYDGARRYPLSIYGDSSDNSKFPADVFAWQGNYCENVSIEIKKFRDARQLVKYNVICGQEGNVLRLGEQLYDIIITDPPYGFNTNDETVKLASFYDAFLERLILSLKDNGQLLICLPERSFSGKISPYFTHKEIVFNRIVSICNSKGLELVSPIYMIPNRELFRPPFYWNAEKALSRSILHIRIRHLSRILDQARKLPDKIAIFMIGPSGSGKTTIADRLKSSFSLKKISGGDMLRKLAKTGDNPEAESARATLSKGGAADDELIIKLYSKYIALARNKNIIFDGNPSGERQVNEFIKILERYQYSILIIKLECSDRTCVERALKNEQRRDDKEESNILSRLSWYKNEVTTAYEVLSRVARRIITIDAEVEKSDAITRAAAGLGNILANFESFR